MQGWVKLHRCLLDKPIWACSTPEQKVILITILLLANHADKEWEWKSKKFNCKPGQFITSSAKLAIASGCSRQNVRTALKRFKNYEFLTYESTKTGLLITVVNWEKYQGNDNNLTNELTNELTNSQPTPNQRLTTNKNDKNVKNDKKDINNTPPTPPKKQSRKKQKDKPPKIHYAEYVTMTEAEYQTLISRFGEADTKRMIEILNAYKGSTGRQYKSDYMTMYSWVYKRLEEEKRRAPNIPPGSQQIPRAYAGLMQMREELEQREREGST